MTKVARESVQRRSLTKNDLDMDRGLRRHRMQRYNDAVDKSLLQCGQNLPQRAAYKRESCAMQRAPQHRALDPPHGDHAGHRIESLHPRGATHILPPRDYFPTLAGDSTGSRCARLGVP